MTFVGLAASMVREPTLAFTRHLRLEEATALACPAIALFETAIFSIAKMAWARVEGVDLGLD